MKQQHLKAENGSDPDEVGPVAESLGRWNGLYVVGDKVVLSYTVLGTPIFEQPGSIRIDGETALARTFKIGAATQPLTLVLDEIWDDRQPRQANRQMAALFDLIPAQGKELRPYDAFNEARLVVRGDSVEHWLNGRRVVRFVRGSEDFRTRVAASKYRDVEGFGEALQGHLLLQDEGGYRVWFRTIKIREL